MPRSLDITPAKKPASVNLKVKAPVTTHRHAYYRRWYILLLAIIIATLLLLIQLQYNGFSVIIGGSETPKTTNNVNTVLDSTSLEESIGGLFKSLENEVKIYRSGASNENVAKITTELEVAGFTVTDLGDSQKQYNNATIWFNQNNLELASKIENVLLKNNYKVQKNQSINTDNIDLILYLGDKK